MLSKANEYIKELIDEIIIRRMDKSNMNCCWFAQRDDNNYYCNGDIEKNEDAIELSCSQCKSLYWEEVKNKMLDEYIVK